MAKGAKVKANLAGRQFDHPPLAMITTGPESPGVTREYQSSYSIP
jgi:hypothetical protein